MIFPRQLFNTAAIPKHLDLSLPQMVAALYSLDLHPLLIEMSFLNSQENFSTTVLYFTCSSNIHALLRAQDGSNHHGEPHIRPIRFRSQ